MSDWQHGGDQGNGTYWYLDLNDHDEDCNGGDECACTIETISAFEDTSGIPTQWYAWNGTYDDHDREMGKSMTGLYPTRDEAVAAIPQS
jgi:hypothetical protein